MGQYTVKAAIVHLVAGRKYAVRIESGYSGGLMLKFVWSRQVPNAEAPVPE